MRMPAFHGGMSDRPELIDHPDPNIVLRGGALDGHRLHVHNWESISLDIDGRLYAYRPLGELDVEYPTLNVYVPDEG